MADVTYEKLAQSAAKTEGEERKEYLLALFGKVLAEALADEADAAEPTSEPRHDIWEEVEGAPLVKPQPVSVKAGPFDI